MSWISQVSRGTGQQQQQPTGSQRLILASSFGAGRSASPLSARLGADLSTPSPCDFPAAPHGAVDQARTENQFSLGSAHTMDPEPISYVTLQEQRCVLSWYQGWTGVQRERFLQDLLGKAVPGKVCTLLESLGSLQVGDKLPNIFECQLRLWTQWFESWGEDERNHFLHMLEERDPTFVAHFYRSVAGTAGRD
ncbi:uncharacterized protein C14orf119 homolog [Xenentodon cancila]